MKLPKELREKKDLGSGTTKKRSCSIKNCSEIAIRSLSENKWKTFVEKANLKFIENKQHKIYLCKSHYKESNKYRKAQEKLYQKKGFLDDASSRAKVKRYD